MAILESSIGNTFLLTVEAFLIIYVLYKLIILLKSKEVSHINGVLSRSIKKAYLIVLTCLSINMASQINAIFELFHDGELPKLLMDVIFESLPTLLLFSLLLTISSFWIEYRVSFEEDTDSVIKNSKKLKRLYMISNLIAFFACAIPATLYFTLYLDLTLRILIFVMMSLIVIGSGILLHQGQKFYKVVIRNYGIYTSSQKRKFLALFCLSLFCLCLKLTNFALITVIDLEEKHDLLTLFFDSARQLGELGLLTLFYLIGEFGSILSLIFLMQHQLQRPKGSMVGTAVSSDIDENEIEGEQIDSMYHEISMNGML